MNTSSNQKASSANSGLSVSMRQGVRVGERGFPIACRCGEFSVIRTSTTTKNPGRSFHCCRNGSETDKNHLFKWADESMIEEIYDMKDALHSSDKDIELMKDNIRGYEKKFEELKSNVLGYEKGVSKMEGDIRFSKTMLIWVVVLIACYCFIWA